MQLIVTHKADRTESSRHKSLLGLCASTYPAKDVLFAGMLCSSGPAGSRNTTLLVPNGWKAQSFPAGSKVQYYDDHIPLSAGQVQAMKRRKWLVISDGRFVAQIVPQLIGQVLNTAQADMVTINARPELLAGRERLRVTSDGKVAGFRRLYFDSVQPAAVTPSWPHHAFIRTAVVHRVLTGGGLPLSFSELLNSFLSKRLTVRAFNIGGTLLDLNSQHDLLAFLAQALKRFLKNRAKEARRLADTCEISEDARLLGPVLFGNKVYIGPNALIVGPTIICSGAKVPADAVVRASVIASDVSLPRAQVIQNRFVTDRNSEHNRNRSERAITATQPKIVQTIVGAHNRPTHNNLFAGNFRFWPRLSYAGCFKRIADIVAATTVLILFAPFFPAIALAIKLTSQGPVFYKDTRQGRYGRTFSCLKLRTMLMGAEKIQDKLRFLNVADGPQFKMPDDPRLSKIGPFLRDTYIDEVPQFINVLLGKMSVVGPRPSPESENTLCPYWRDARLSVRPGITGLWQVCRTRRPMQDFQEWIYYDTRYVRDLSLKMDLSICWKTFVRMARNFVKQF